MVSSSLIRILEDKSLTQQKIQEIIDQSMKQSQYGFMIQKLIVTDNRGRLLASFPRMDISFYPSDEILTSLAGYKVIKRDSENQTMIFAFPIKSGKSVERSLYLEVSCQSILETVTDIKIFYLWHMLLVWVFHYLLDFCLQKPFPIR